MKHPVPTSIGKYQIERVIGQGGMGVVYAGRDPHIERPVAIKRLHSHLVSGDDGATYRERFRREAKAAARCEHRNIVRVLEYGEDDGLPYLVMEYVVGVPLDEHVEKRGALKLKTVLSIMSQLFHALHRAHSMGITHRDIKPANVLILPTGSVKLTDFGVAHLATDAAMTQVGSVVGTPRYMSPEQALGMDVDGRTDIFALGILAHELLTLCDYPSDVVLATMPRPGGLGGQIALRADVPIPASMIPPVLDAIAPDANKRHGSIKDFARAMQAALTQLTDPSALTRIPDLTDQSAIITEKAAPVVSPRFTARSESNTRPDTTPGELSILGGDITSTIDESVMSDVRERFTNAVGSESHTLIARHATEAISFAEFMHALANEIAKPRQRRKFLAHWNL